MIHITDRLAEIAGILSVLNKQADADWLLSLARELLNTKPCQQCGRRLVPNEQKHHT